MEKEIIKQWDNNKNILENYFRTTKQSEYCDYETIVQKIFELCVIESFDDYYRWDVENMTVVDNGDYQGTQIFIIPSETYQPSIGDYVITSVGYGSCSGCDTLQGISEYSRGLPTEDQVKEYMTLALHLVQRAKRLGINEY